MKKIVEAVGYRLSGETPFNWIFLKHRAKKPLVIVPKLGHAVSPGILLPLLSDMGMDRRTYSALAKRFGR